MSDTTTEGQYGDAVRSLVEAAKGEAELHREVAALRATVKRVEALADEWEEGSSEPPYPDTFYGIALRAALIEGADQ